MKLRFETVFRGYIFVLVALLFWSIWANAQSNVTNTTPAGTAAKTNLLAKKLGKIDEHYVTFELDRLELLRENTFLGEPLWKYAASAIYIPLAFCVSNALGFHHRRLAETLGGEDGNEG